MYSKYGDDVQFFLIYIREAHPIDGWQVGANIKEEVLFDQPKTLEQREDIAAQMCHELKLSLPTLIDDLDDHVNQAYAAWPDRLYLVGVDGKIAYGSGPGPGGFRPPELEAAIKKALGRSTEAGEEPRRPVRPARRGRGP